MKSFRFSTTALDTSALQLEMRDVTCGGFAAFEGWVRNHNEGLEVTRLEYEAFAELAEKEGTRIVDEAIARFGVARAACVHRVGSLGLRDVAVWVGVSAAHRDEAFRACRYIIDEVKHRVPIWKKEHYVNGDSGWVNCERCAAPAAHEVEDAAPAAHEVEDAAAPAAHGRQYAAPPAYRHARGHTHGHDHDHEHEHHHRPETPDYSRQIALREVGEEGQARLRAASVLVVGAGGLGVPVLQYLAGAGVGRIGIVDADRLEPSNLHRQTWYALADCGREKSTLASERVRALNPDVRVESHALRLDNSNADRLAAGHDLILDCSDNFTTKFLLNDLALRARKPVLFASVYQYEGQLQLVRGDDATACLRCVWPQATRDGLVGNCAEAGVLGPVPGVFGSLQALEALKLLLGLPGLNPSEMLIFDLVSLNTQRLRARRSEGCEAHARAGSAAASTAPIALEVQFASLAEAQAAGYTFIDVRDARERADDPLPSAALNLPMSKLLTDAGTLDSDGRYLLICATGKRSAAAADLLRSQGFGECRSLRGGIKGLKTPA
jgi:molybdopterin/thiamine biosynthesis adenylyltransferase/molybdopterin synthase catalytic subunit/rhodanese-related sulfurtransferase